MFKLNEKAATVKHAISIVEAENETNISQILTRISLKRVEISAAESEKDMVVQAAKAGVDNYILKPLTKNKVWEKLQGYCD